MRNSGERILMRRLFFSIPGGILLSIALFFWILNPFLQGSQARYIALPLLFVVITTVIEVIYL